MLLPYRAKNPPESFPFACAGLILLNIIVFVATSDGMSIRPEIARGWGLSANNATLGTYISSMFLHANWMHLLGNMWFLYLFGTAVEGRLKAPKFLAGYFIAGFFGSFLHQLLSGHLNPDLPGIGASGAIMGVMGMALRMFPHAQIEVFYWVGLIRLGTMTWKMMWVALMYFTIDLLYGLLFMGVKVGGGTAHFAHVGGVIAGFIVGLILCRNADTEEVSEAKASVAEMKDYSALECIQMEDLYKNTPNDALLVHTWMWRALIENKVKPEVLEAFLRLLPKIQHDDPETLANTLNMFHAQFPDRAPLALMVRMAEEMEKNANPQLAITLVTAAIHDTRISDADCRAGVLLAGKIQEMWFKQYQGAQSYYTYFLNRWQMDPMEGYVRERLKVVEAKLAELAAVAP